MILREGSLTALTNPPEEAAAPVEVRGDAEEVLEDLGGRVHDDGEGGDEVDQQHHLHHRPLPPPRHGEHDVVLHEVAQRVVAGHRHREVDEEQN